MKVSSISSNPVETGIFPDQQSQPFMQSVRHGLSSILKVVDRIGTSVALGESGDLDAAHEFRIKQSRTNK